MSDVNRILLQGEVTAAPRVVQFADDGRLVNLRVRTRDAGDGTAWYTVVVRGARSISEAETLVEGASVYVEGVLVTREFINRHGEEVSLIEVRSRTVFSVSPVQPDWNHAVLLGEVTSVKEPGRADSGEALDFVVVTRGSWVTPDGTRKEASTGHHVTARPGLAGGLRLSPGQRVLVSGLVRTRRIGGEDRNPSYRAEIHATSVIPAT